MGAPISLGTPDSHEFKSGRGMEVRVWRVDKTSVICTKNCIDLYHELVANGKDCKMNLTEIQFTGTTGRGWLGGRANPNLTLLGNWRDQHDQYGPGVPFI